MIKTIHQINKKIFEHFLKNYDGHKSFQQHNPSTHTLFPLFSRIFHSPESSNLKNLPDFSRFFENFSIFVLAFFKHLQTPLEQLYKQNFKQPLLTKPSQHFLSIFNLFLTPGIPFHTIQTLQYFLYFQYTLQQPSNFSHTFHYTHYSQTT